MVLLHRKQLPIKKCLQLLMNQQKISHKQVKLETCNTSVNLAHAEVDVPGNLQSKTCSLFSSEETRPSLRPPQRKEWERHGKSLKGHNCPTFLCVIFTFATVLPTSFPQKKEKRKKKRKKVCLICISAISICQRQFLLGCKENTSITQV